MRKTLAALLVATAALAATGCSQEPPPVSEKVAKAYATGTALPSPTQDKPAPTVAFIGDSYTAGSGTTSQTMRWSTRLAVAHGWREANFGLGGTGYFMANRTPQGLIRQPYAARIQEVAQAKPDVVIVSGGINDAAAETKSVIEAVHSFYAALRKAVPKARIIALNPLWGEREPIPAAIPEISAAVKDASAGVGGTFLDIGQPLTGHPELVAPDNVHPNDDGAGEIARLANLAIAKSPALSGIGG